MTARPAGQLPHEIMVPMRDGVRLFTRIWCPADTSGASRFPVVLSRGYRAGSPEDALRFVEAGYVYVGQAARGEPNSEGELNRFFTDAEDGYDTLTWISSQKWSDRRIAMYGRSYWAATQWLVAPLGHPALKAIVPQNVADDFWECGYWCHGALSLAMTAAGRAYQTPEQGKTFGWKSLYRYLPLIDLDIAVAGSKNRMWREYVSHSVYDDYWRALSIRRKYDQIRIPVFLMGGWYDYYAGAALRGFRSLTASRSGSDIRVDIGPSDHLSRVPGDRNFGPASERDDTALAIRWLDYVVRGHQNTVRKERPVRLFVMGANEWRQEDEWPLARTRFIPFYLHSPNGDRHGRLHTRRPGLERPSRYLYDPHDPVLTLGGNHSFLGTDHPELIRVGPVDQRPNEQRTDVLVFTSHPLEEGMEVTGPVELILYAASTARDTDFTAKLIDVYPDGTSYNLTEGIIRARFRDSLWNPPQLIKPGQIYRYVLRLHPTSNVFHKRHRIQVHISSSNFPLWDRNSNTGHEPATNTDLISALQTIYHDEDHPSHILLPVIPFSSGYTQE